MFTEIEALLCFRDLGKVRCFTPDESGSAPGPLCLGDPGVLPLQ